MKWHIVYTYPNGVTYERDTDYFSPDVHLRALEKCELKKVSIELNPISKW